MYVDACVHASMHVCMYVCMYVVRMYMHACTYVCMYVCMYVCCMYVRACMYVHVCMYVCMYVVRMYMHVCMYLVNFLEHTFYILKLNWQCHAHLSKAVSPANVVILTNVHTNNIETLFTLMITSKLGCDDHR